MKRHDLWYSWVSIEAGLRQAARFKFSIKVEKRKTGESASIAGLVSPIGGGFEIWELFDHDLGHCQQAEGRKPRGG